MRRAAEGRTALGLVTLVVWALATGCDVGPTSSSQQTPPSGNLWTWGPFPTPVHMNLASGVRFTRLAGSAYHLMGLDSKGQAWAWGFNDSGQLGNNSTRPRPEPGAVQMPSGITFKAIAAGDGDSFALDVNGHAWAWGNNRQGQLGNGSTANSSVPVAVIMPPGVEFTSITAGAHTVALDKNGQAWAWGYNRDGELGDGSIKDSSRPVRVRMIAGVRFMAIAAGTDFTIALDQDGHPWAWGYNDHGELGLGTSGPRSTPVQLTLPDGIAFTVISAEVQHTLARDRNGKAWTWGFTNVHNQGSLSTAIFSSPTPVPMPAGVVFATIAAGPDHSLALDQSGQAWGWGDDSNYQLGDGKARYAFNPVAVSMPKGVRFSELAAGICCSFALSG